MNVRSDDSDFSFLKVAGTLAEQRGLAFIIVAFNVRCARTPTTHNLRSYWDFGDANDAFVFSAVGPR
jgi:hypothetical protein